MNELIAIVEDEHDIAELIALHARRVGYRTMEFPNGNVFRDFLKTNSPDLVLLDLMLPDTNGIDICKFIRADTRLKNTPLIILTAKADEFDTITGLEFGADDYIAKPFSVKELMARIKAVLRRNSEIETKTSVYSIQNILYIDIDKYIVMVKGKSVDLTTAEFNLLKLLASKKGWVFSRDKILNHLWGEDKIVLDRTVDVHIKNLREKLGAAGKFIHNVRGVGYKLDD